MTYASGRITASRRGGRLAVIAVVAGVLDIALAVAWTWTRPPCAPGSARLLDVIPIALIGGAVVCAVAASLLAGFAGALRRRGLVWLYRLLTIPVLVVAGLLLIGLVSSLTSAEHWQPYDTTCWTF